jgi:hypothetical protein
MTDMPPDEMHPLYPEHPLRDAKEKADRPSDAAAGSALPVQTWPHENKTRCKCSVCGYITLLRKDRCVMNHNRGGRPGAAVCKGSGIHVPNDQGHAPLTK